MTGTEMTGAGLAMDPELADLAGQVFGEIASGRALPEPGQEFARHWARAAEAGLPWVSVPETAGGSGGTLRDAVTIAYAAGAQAVPLPVIETMLAGWLHTEAGLAIRQVPMSLAAHPASLAIDGDYVRGTAHAVAWGSDVTLIAAVAGDSDGMPRLVTWRPDEGSATVRSSDLAGQPRTSLHLDRLPVARHSLPPHVPGRLRDRAALLRSAQMAGAMNAITALTIGYTSGRTQFGKPLAAFQAVQQHLVTIAEAATITSLNVARAADAVAAGGGAFEAAAVKHLANENATACVQAAYQAHGAMGLTREYPLHRFTRRLLVWRDEDGTRKSLTSQLAAALATAGDLAALVQGRHDSRAGA